VRVRLPINYLIAFGLVALVTLLGELIFSAGSITNVGLLFLLPVLFVASRYGLRVGIVTSLVSSLTYNFFFIPPTHTFTIQDPQNIITVLVLLGVAVASSQLAARTRDQALLAQRSADQNRSLAGFARQLTVISKVDELSQLLCREIGQLLHVHTLLLLPERGDLVMRAAEPADAHLEAIEWAAARWAYEHNQSTGRSAETMTASEWLFQPLAASGPVLGVFGLARPDAGTPIRSDQLPLLLSLLDQAALALERIALEAEMATVTQLKERDRLRAALLSSVSHDLRTPLTTIVGMLGEMNATTQEQGRQLKEARGEAERLSRFVANLLDMVRIETGALHQSIEPVDLSEAATAAVHDLRRIVSARQIKLDVPPDLPLILVDPQLFHHCLINLIENAAKYGSAGAPILISGRRDSTGLMFSVLDEGPGVPEGEERRIFETFARIEGSDRKGGTGLGLAIVKGFAEAMGLSVEASNRLDRAGASFGIHIPEAKLVTGAAPE
jgi:two-component system, OmpR family, sensor histidine kinase KdpD